MSIDSMDKNDNVNPVLFDQNIEDYIAACDNEVNDVIPRLESLNITDDAPGNSPSRIINMSDLCINPVPNSINSLEAALIVDRSEDISPTYVCDIPGEICVEVTETSVESELPLSTHENTSPLFSTSRMVDAQFQNVNQKSPKKEKNHIDPANRQKENMLKIENNKETVDKRGCFKGPLDLSSKRMLDHNEGTSCSLISKNEIKPPSLVDKKNVKLINPETGELERFSLIHRCYRTEIAPDHSTGKFADTNDFQLDSYKLSYSANESFDNQSQNSSGIMIDSPPGTPVPDTVNASSSEDKSSRKIESGDEDNSSKKIVACASPVSEIRETRQRRFGVFQPPFVNIDASKTNSSDDLRKSSAIEKDSQTNSGRKCKRTVKSPLMLKDANREEKRPSPCKRKKSNSENMTETPGKIFKRSISEHEGCGKTQLVIRSRSLSTGSKNIKSTPVENPLTKNSIPQSRKRTNSDQTHTNNEIHVKSRRSSIWSEINQTCKKPKCFFS